VVIADFLIYICCVLIVLIPLFIAVIINLYIQETINASIVPYIGEEEGNNTFFYSAMWMDE